MIIIFFFAFFSLIFITLKLNLSLIRPAWIRVVHADQVYRALSFDAFSLTLVHS